MATRDLHPGKLRGGDEPTKRGLRNMAAPKHPATRGRRNGACCTSKKEASKTGLLEASAPKASRAHRWRVRPEPGPATGAWADVCAAMGGGRLLLRKMPPRTLVLEITRTTPGDPEDGNGGGATHKGPEDLGQNDTLDNLAKEN